MTKVETAIEKLRTKEGNCRAEAYQLEQKAIILRTRESTYREAWQAIEEAHKSDSSALTGQKD